MQQEILKFNYSQDYKEIDFILSDCNKKAYEVLLSENSPANLFLYGEKSSGKTHLANIWAKKNNAIILSQNDLEIISEYNNLDIKNSENIVFENINLYNSKHQEALFLLLNKYLSEGKKILLTSELEISSLNFQFEDLTSRIKTFYTVKLENPDYNLVISLIIKLFSDEQYSISVDVAEFISKRISRDFNSIKNIVEEIIKKAMQSKKKITLPFVKSVIENL